MANQPGLDILSSSLPLDLHEEINPPENEEEGVVKSQTAIANGEVIYNVDSSDHFSILVDRMLVVDGWGDATVPNKQAMTLMVLHYQLKCSDPDGRFQDVHTLIKFEDSEGTKEEDKAAPEMVFWAPFRKTLRYNESEANVSKKTEGGGELGGGFSGAEGKATFNRSEEMSWKKKYFDECWSKETVNKTDGRQSGVEWYMKHNPLQDHGVSNDFSVAILFKRKTQSPFLVSKFEIRVHAGWKQEIKRGVKRAFGFHPDRTKPIPYQPQVEPRPRSVEGDRLLAMVNPDRLGLLLQPGELVKLTTVWGVQPES
jgi:hypothetical protein